MLVFSPGTSETKRGNRKILGVKELVAGKIFCSWHGGPQKVYAPWTFSTAEEGVFQRFDPTT